MSRFIKPMRLRVSDKELDRHATWLEIFFDLIFAVIVFQLSDRLFHHFDIMGVLKCSALFVPVIWTWVSYTVFSARFDNDDIIHWLMTFMIMFASIIMAIQVRSGLEIGANGFAIGFLMGQLSIILLYARRTDDDLSKHISRFYLIGFMLAGCCWVISLFVNAPTKFILWIIGMSIYLIMPWMGRKRLLSRAPLNSSYIPERFGAFTIIILGQIIASVVFGLESATWSMESLLTSIMAFILAIVIWSQYYQFNLTADYQCTLGSGQFYIYWHIPLIMSLVIIGVCSQEFIQHATMIHQLMNKIMGMSIITYLISFCALQYIAIPKFNIQIIFYLLTITAILLLFFPYPLSPIVTMLGVIIIFISLFGVQYLFSV